MTSQKINKIYYNNSVIGKSYKDGVVRSVEVGGFDPRSIAGLEGWWDASDASTVTLNSGNVSEWRDKSGNGYHLTQSTAADQPAYSTTSDQINGLNTITFTRATNQRLVNASISVSVPVVFAVFRINTYTPNLSAGATVFDTFNAGSGRCILYALENSSTAISYQRANGAASDRANGSFVFGETQVACAESFSAGHRIYNDGTQGTDATTGSNGLDGIVAGHIRGNPSVISSAYSLSGQLCELLVYSSAFSVSQRQTVERWLAGRWGVTIA